MIMCFLFFVCFLQTASGLNVLQNEDEQGGNDSEEADALDVIIAATAVADVASEIVEEEAIARADEKEDEECAMLEEATA